MTLQEIQTALCSVIAIPVTPFHPDGSVDYQGYGRLLSRLITNGINVVTPNGNTSEFYSLNPVESRRLLEETVLTLHHNRQRALILAGVGFDVQTAIETAEMAQVMEVQAVMIHQLVHPYRSDEGWIAYHKAIADAVPEMGIVPYVRDASISGATIKRLADLCPNFVGIKYAVGNPPLFAKIVREVGPDRLAWICGIAESWAPFFWVAGAKGFTSGLVNVTTVPSLRMLAALNAGDYAQAMSIWAQVKPFEDLRARRDNANNVSAVKEAMTQLGLCDRFVRPPISELPESEQAEIGKILLGLELQAE